MTSRQVVTYNLRIGEVVFPVVIWGSQQRLRCPACQHFTVERPVVTCRCGAVYHQIGDTTDYLVEALP